MDMHPKRYRWVFTAILVIAISTTIGMLFFSVLGPKYLAGSAYDTRSNRLDLTVRRGNFYDRNGQLLNYSEWRQNAFQRFYNYPSLYSLVIGYKDRTYGTYGLESTYNNLLEGVYPASERTRLLNTFFKEKVGDHVNLTLDHRLQRLAAKSLGKHDGCIIVSDPKNGQILAEYAYPGFDERNISSAMMDGKSSFYPRVTKGKYMPGSAMKILSALELMALGKTGTYKDKGYVEIGGERIKNYGGVKFGNVTLESAFSSSVNTYFIHQMQGDSKALQALLNHLTSSFEALDPRIRNAAYLEVGDSEFANALLTIGQGKVMMSPLLLHYITQMVYNEGSVYELHEVLSTMSRDHEALKFYIPKSTSVDIPADHFKRLKQMMFQVAEHGTASGFGLPNCGGKTGTAELGNGKVHYWFTGFYEDAEHPLIFTILVENSEEMWYNPSVTIAKKMLDFWRSI